MLNPLTVAGPPRSTAQSGGRQPCRWQRAPPHRLRQKRTKTKTDQHASTLLCNSQLQGGGQEQEGPHRFLQSCRISLRRALARVRRMGLVAKTQGMERLPCCSIKLIPTDKVDLLETVPNASVATDTSAIESHVKQFQRRLIP